MHGSRIVVALEAFVLAASTVDPSLTIRFMRDQSGTYRSYRTQRPT